MLIPEQTHRSSVSGARRKTRKTAKRRRRFSAVSSAVYKNSRVYFIELGKGRRAMIDAEDWPRIRKEYGALWHANSNGKTGFYARREVKRPGGERQYVTLQRAVLGAEPEQRVKVINGNPLDCRKANLKFMSEAEKKEMIRRHAK